MSALHNSQSGHRTGRTLLLACGNALRGDDGVGWRIGRAAEKLPLRSDLSVILTHQLLPEHAHEISEAEIVIFVDCSAVAQPGTVSVLPVEPETTVPCVFTHHLDPASLLALARQLYASGPRQAVLITVGGASFELTDQLSRTVKAAIPVALKVICQAFQGAGLSN